MNQQPDHPAACVAILGASPNTERYSWKAQQLLTEHGYQVQPVSVKYDVVDGLPAIANLADSPAKIDTVTVYLNPARLTPYVEQIVAAAPRRVIFNPGSESAQASKALQQAGIDVIEACTLVMLRTGQF